MKVRSCLIPVVISMFFGAASASGEILYDVIDMGTLPGYYIMQPWGLNNNGQVVGGASPEDYRGGTAFLFDSSGGGSLVDLGGLGVESSAAVSINNKGQIAGPAFDASWQLCVAVFDSSGQGNNTLIYNQGTAWSINNDGIIAGSIGTGTYPWDVRRAARFDAANPLSYADLGSLAGLDSSEAVSINNNSAIVGYAYNSTSQYMYDTRAVLFDGTNPQNNKDLGSLPGYGYALAFSINDSGQIVGRANHQDLSVEENYIPRAVLFNPSDASLNIDLGSLEGIAGAEAFSINNHGQIVGRAIDSWPSTAILFDSSGQGNNLNLNDLIDPSLGYDLTNAIAINDYGWIACWATSPSNQPCGVLLRPVPEPSVILFLGFGGLAVLRRRRVK